jgi:predicted Zn-dependent protease
MTDVHSSRLIAAAAVLIVLAVAWDALASHRAPATRAPTRVSAPAADTTRPAARPQPAATASQGTSTDSSGESHYLEQLARSETRRRVRASAGATYLNEIVAESQDSALHRWNHRATDPVRVYLPPGTVANFHTEFLDAIRTAFRQWEQVGVPVSFDVNADSSRAEVTVRWKIQFDIDRTGQTDLEWNQDGHILKAVVTIATFDPKGRPLESDDVRAIALHEVGHVLGLDHSPDSTDLMYARGNTRQITDRDVRTVTLLYQLSPGSLR